MSGGRCAACKYLRRRCPPDCIFSPYFPSNDPERFACVHRIYGASNVSKMLQQLPVELRGETADSLTFEAQCRIQDPVYGCVGLVYLLQQQIHVAESQLSKAQAEMVVFTSHAQEQEAQPRPQLQQFEPGFGFNNTSLPEGPEQVNFGHFGLFPSSLF
ncbi:hypothetical protein ACOSP7_027388 [Xanthoceras sorbifolium]|uniref:LOB domain-containing protein n=1 Tax=Xanthoceras sorbifolium TaxID=99658 RepID=A0ABQ8HG24_9ROSI|nr:hypothetical protein JRO89_XS11G0185200 [Xanthoceras sorbifolium]